LGEEGAKTILAGEKGKAAVVRAARQTQGETRSGVGGVGLGQEGVDRVGQWGNGNGIHRRPSCQAHAACQLSRKRESTRRITGNSSKSKKAGVSRDGSRRVCEEMAQRKL